MGKTLFVGELNPYGADPRFALYDEPRGSAGHRLRVHVLGLPSAVYLGPGIERVNLCVGKWSAKAARAAAQALWNEQQSAARRDVVVLLGRRVRDAFGFVYSLADPPHVVHMNGPAGPWDVVTLPHPSGRCRLWSEPGMVARCRALLARVAPDVSWGSADAEEAAA